MNRRAAAGEADEFTLAGAPLNSAFPKFDSGRASQIITDSDDSSLILAGGPENRLHNSGNSGL